MPLTLTLLMESFETFHVQADIAFPTLFLHFHAAHCTTSLRAYRLNVVVAIHAYFHWCTLIQRLRAPNWSPDSRAFECIFFCNTHCIHCVGTPADPSADDSWPP